MKYNTIRKIASTVLALGLLSGCFGSRNGPPASVHYDKAVSPYHIVKRGDSIASIARKYKMDKRELIRVNGLESPYRIVKGQRLIVKPHRTKVGSHDDLEGEAPANEEVSSVPEEEGVQVKKLAPASGLKGETSGKSRVHSDENQEVDDESQTEEAETVDDDNTKRKYDEDNIDDAEGKSKRQKMDPSGYPTSEHNYRMPVDGKVIRQFSQKGKGKLQNDGINIAAAKGTPVVAANSGVVVVAKKHVDGFGWVVILKHDNGTMTVYGHLDQNSIIVNNKQAVKAGQKLGTVGQSGKAKEPQVFFQVRENGKIVDPKKYVNY